MIKIFSIKEILDASENILSLSNQKKTKEISKNRKFKKKTNNQKSFKKILITEEELKNTNEVLNNEKQNIKKNKIRN